ncbi:MAG: hypothetical protein HY720_16280 [Planctomycetes bacterium]|nr:hypothetical protein [Planctomycetota bacterium]
MGCLAATLFLTASGCSKPEEEGGDRVPAPAGAQDLLARPSRIRAAAVLLALSRAYEPELSHFAGRRDSTRIAGKEIFRGWGDCKIVVRELVIECREYTLKFLELEDGVDAPPAFDLLASGGVELVSGPETSRADLVRVENGSISYEGEFWTDVETKVGTIQGP